MSESKETTKMKVVQLHEYTQKQLSNPTPTPKKPIGPQKINNYPKIKLKSKVRIERNIENESCSTTWVDPKTVVKPYPIPKIANQGPKK